jgi:cell wall-associated NlpC family hydrolase
MTIRQATWPCVLLAMLSLSLTGCASREPRIRVLPPVGPAPAEAPPVAVTPDVSIAGEATSAEAAIVHTAETLLGAPYRDGGTLPDGFDCSGLVTYVFARNGVAVPRDVRRQAAAGIAVERAGILPGDLLFFTTTGPGPTHVGIAIGAGRFIHAPKSGTVVRVESLASGYWAARFLAARRIL